MGIAARMLHAAHGAQDAHAVLDRHLKALTKPSGRVRGVWRGGRQGRRPFQALVDGHRARAANSSGARDGARREPQRHHHLPGECPQPGAWPAYHPTGCLAWSEAPTHAAPTKKPTAAGSAHSGNSKRHRADDRPRTAASRGGARGPAKAGWRGSWDGGHCGAHASRSARCPRRTRGIRPSP